MNDVVLLPHPTRIAKRGLSIRLGPGRCQISGCSSPRVRNALLRISLGGIEVNVNISNQEFKEVPELDDGYGYRMKVREEMIEIESDTEWGALMACSTLAQMSAYSEIPECDIDDEPRYPWRGLMVDVSRHFFQVETLKTTLDLMHIFKLNVLHLHLTDDQGFRIQTNSHPELASQESYSPAELSDLVRYAADRAIRVVPEIDVPAHTTCWLLARPEWGTEEIDQSKLHSFGVHTACLDPSNPDVLKALKTIFREVGEMFPDDYVHIGGDEVDPTWWDRSERVQEWAHANGLKNVGEIQTYFTCELTSDLESNGKTVLAWDEALNNRLPTTVAMQAWRGVNVRDQALNSGHDTIVSAPYYLDLNYPAALHVQYWPDMSSEHWRHANEIASTDERLAHVRDGVLWHHSIAETLEFPTRLGGRVLGGEACMWSELVAEPLLHKRIWGRMPVIAEVFWSPTAHKDEIEMYERLTRCLRNLGKLGLPDVVSYKDVHEVQALIPLFEMLEPVKWYARTLGMDRVRARATGQKEPSHPRPYDARSSLNRVVDYLPPDGLLIRQCELDVRNSRDLSGWIQKWRTQYEVFDEVVREHPDLAELKDASQALRRIADVAQGTIPADATLAGPFGEYLVPIVFAFVERDS